MLFASVRDSDDDGSDVPDVTDDDSGAVNDDAVDDDGTDGDGKSNNSGRCLGFVRHHDIP